MVEDSRGVGRKDCEEEGGTQIALMRMIDGCNDVAKISDSLMKSGMSYVGTVVSESSGEIRTETRLSFQIELNSVGDTSTFDANNE